MYPRSAEVYQLLAKAVHITSNWTEGSVLPVLVCRRANPILIYMAKHLGFHVIEVINQVVDMKRMGGPETAERRFREVRSELSFLDMIPYTNPPTRILNQFREQLPPYIVEKAKTWADIGSRFGDWYELLRDSSLPWRERSDLLEELRGEVSQLLPGVKLGW
jgi:hypothetical protein